MLLLPKSWHKHLQQELERPYFVSLLKFLDDAYATRTVYPPHADIFRAFSLTSFEDVRVVIVGQDPYHGPGEAHGLCFSVQDGVKNPPSLRNIFKEISSEYGSAPTHGNLKHWAEQGVLLLNTTLTVEKDCAGSHQGKGWETFTDAVLKKISDEKEHVVFLLWGNYARKKGVLIDPTKHLILESAHPSPLSAPRGFFGNEHFKKVNEYLTAHNLPLIHWTT